MLSSMAQGITGKVIDENNSPLDFVNVVLLNKNDSKLYRVQSPTKTAVFFLRTLLMFRLFSNSLLSATPPYQKIYPRQATWE